jgi:hypothetical protein
MFAADPEYGGLPAPVPSAPEPGQASSSAQTGWWSEPWASLSMRALRTWPARPPLT